jgi:hypothetical protein
VHRAAPHPVAPVACLDGLAAGRALSRALGLLVMPRAGLLPVRAARRAPPYFPFSFALVPYVRVWFLGGCPLQYSTEQACPASAG